MFKTIKVLPDSSVKRARFLTQKNELGEETGIYLANPETISALKKDVLVWEEILNDKTIACKSCGEFIHANIWKYCPFCLKNHLDESIGLNQIQNLNQFTPPTQEL